MTKDEDAILEDAEDENVLDQYVSDFNPDSIWLIVLRRLLYKGKKAMDLRVYRKEGKHGPCIRTQRGVRMAFEEAEEIYKKFGEMLRKWRKERK